ISAGFWAFSVIFTVHFMVPLALTLLPRPKKTENNNQGFRVGLAAAMEKTGGNVKGARYILAGALTVMVASSYWAVNAEIGELEVGSPILHPDHDYNVSTAQINEKFPGSEELHVVARTEKPGDIKRPEVL